MAHTVICVCTVYFTAIVGCAFSSPRHTAGENSQEDSNQNHAQKEDTVVTLAAPEADDSTNSTEYEETSPMVPKLEDTGGGTVQSNISGLKDNTDGNSTEHLGNDTAQVALNSTYFRQLLEQRHKENIKSQIIEKLRLPFPPVMRYEMPKLPLEDIEKEYFKTSNDAKYRERPNYYAKTVRKFIQGQDVTQKCYKKSAGCYHFDLRGRVDPSEVESVYLWIYKLFNHHNQYSETFIISELEKLKRRKDSLRIRNLGERFETNIKYGWLKIDVTTTAMKWLLKPRHNHGMAVICKGCKQHNYNRIFSTKEDYQPFLVIQTRRAHRREKRSFDNKCTDSSTECCLMPFTINFQDIGWNAIAYPPSIEVNYCTGSCHGRTAMTTNHTNLIQTFRWSSASERQMDELTPCCSPISYKAQSILYFDGDKLQETRIPNVAVTRCGCI